VNIFLCEGNLLHSHACNQEKQLYLLFCVEACQYFTDISVSDDKSAYLGMLPTIKVSTVICIGALPHTLRYKRICLHFGSLFLQQVFSLSIILMLEQLLLFISVILLVRSLLKVLSLL
jgi:hypothetical protein